MLEPPRLSSGILRLWCPNIGLISLNASHPGENVAAFTSGLLLVKRHPSPPPTQSELHLRPVAERPVIHHYRGKEDDESSHLCSDLK